jgi:hypothetical protein
VTAPATDRPLGDAGAPNLEPDPEQLEGEPADALPPLGAWPVRLSIAVGLPVAGAGIMVGGIFEGPVGRIDAVLAGVLGVALAAAMSRVRRAALVNLGVLVGVLLIGLLLVVPNGLDSVLHIRTLVQAAAKSHRVLRPPVPLDPGWQALIGWIMALVGVVVAWSAIVLRRPGFSFLMSLPVMVAAAISVPKDAQVASGLAVFALLGLGLGVLAGARRAEELDEDQQPSVASELRRTLRAAPLVVGVVGAMYLLAQTNVLFPAPAVDPTHKPQRPHAVPLSKVPDRVLFDVVSSVSGPWRIGSLDVYDGKDWLLPPYAESSLAPVDKSGIVNPDLTPGIHAKFTVAGLTGTVLPGLPNLYGIVATGPKLVYDDRNGNVRISQGQIPAGFEYDVAGASLPTVDALRKDSTPLPDNMKSFVDVPPMPPAVVELMGKASKASKWDTFDYLRSYVLDNVTATGTGSPVSVPPSRVQSLLTEKEGSPFEIVATQALLARWAGIPSRIGYGFDGGTKVGDHLEVRPKNGATFVEVFFPGHGWLPVLGTPKNAKATLGGDPNEQQVNKNVLPSKDIAIQLYIPEIVPPASAKGRVLLRIVEIAGPAILLLVLAYFLFPGLQKAIRRLRRRRLAELAGPRTRIALAYAEWRDWATDFGFGYPSDTPLAYLGRFVPDNEHRQLAWLVTRTLWGDLREQCTNEEAQLAEEMSRGLRRRLSAAQPTSLRLIAIISRLSVRSPYLDEPAQPSARPPAAQEVVREDALVG